MDKTLVELLQEKKSTLLVDIEEVCYRVDQLRVDLENRYPSVVTNRRKRKTIRADLRVIDKALTDLEELSSTLFYAGRVNDG